MPTKPLFRFGRIRDLSLKLDKEIMKFLDQRQFNHLKMNEAEALLVYLAERRVRSNDWDRVFHKYMRWLHESFEHTKLVTKAADGTLAFARDKSNVAV